MNMSDLSAELYIYKNELQTGITKINTPPTPYRICKELNQAINPIVINTCAG